MTISENVTGVVKDVAAKLPPYVLGLLCINAVFILGLLWFMHDIQIERISAIKSIFETCTAAINHTLPLPSAK